MLITQKCSNTNGYSDFGFQAKTIFCLICYVKAAIALYDYSIAYSLLRLALVLLPGWRAASIASMPVPLSVPLDDDVSFPLATGSTAGAYPPLGVLAWVGGVAWCCARVGLLYIS